jgi:chorismate mutase/prephenate dehydratase
MISLMSQSTIEELKRQLASLDEKLHDSIMKRVELSARISELEVKNNTSDDNTQHQRDIETIHHLLNRHAGKLPHETIVRLWREVCATTFWMRKSHKVAVTMPDAMQGMLHWDMAKDYFGRIVPLQKVTNPVAALSLVKEREVKFAVLPWPQDDAVNAWWRYIMDEMSSPKLRIIARLPFGEQSYDNGNPACKLLVVAAMDYEVGINDRAFIALQLEQRVSRGRILDKCQLLGLTPHSLNSGASAHPDFTDHIIEVSGFDVKDVNLLKELLSKLESDNGYASYIGGYPKPPIYDALDEEIKQNDKVTWIA